MITHLKQEAQKPTYLPVFCFRRRRCRHFAYSEQSVTSSIAELVAAGRAPVYVASGTPRIFVH